MRRHLVTVFALLVASTWAAEGMGGHHAQLPRLLVVGRGFTFAGLIHAVGRIKP